MNLFRVKKQRKILQIALCAGVLFLRAAVPAFALPETDNVESGNVRFEQPDANTMNIIADDKSVINFKSFNIAQNEIVNFIQPSAASSVLNRVTGNEASRISGGLFSNGMVYLVNRNGIHFTPSASVNVAGLVASTLDITTNNFIQQNYIFEHLKDEAYAQILNEGKITAGNLALIASAVTNNGVVVAQTGTVHLVSGDKTVVSFDDRGLIQVQVDEETSGQVVDLVTGKTVKDAVSNSGSIEAHQVVMNARTANNIFERAVNQKGIVKATKLVKVNGVIKLVANGNIQASGTTQAEGGKTEVKTTQSVAVEEPWVLRGDTDIQADKDVMIKSNMTQEDGTLKIMADSDGDGVGQFTQAPETTIYVKGTGDLYIDGSQTMTLETLMTDFGAIKVGTRRDPDVIAGHPRYVHAEGDLTITRMTDTGEKVTLETDRGDVLKYAKNGEVTLAAPNGMVRDLSQSLIPAETLKLEANRFDLISAAPNTELYKSNGDFVINDLKKVGDWITIEADDLGTVTLKVDSNVTFKTDGMFGTRAGVIIPGNQITVVARRFGSNSNPVVIDAKVTKIERLGEDIDILGSLGIGTSIMIHGPPNTWGAIQYNHDSELILKARRVSLSGNSPISFFGNITFYNFFVQNLPGKEIVFEAGRTYTFRDSVTVEGLTGGYNIVTLRSSQTGTPWFINLETENYLFKRVGVCDSVNVSGTVPSHQINEGDGLSLASIYASPSSNFGGNSGWVLNTVYWVGGGTDSNWSNPSNWDGGMPSGQDVVFNSAHDSGAHPSIIDLDSTVSNLTIDGWGGVLTQSARLTIAGNYTQTSGTFQGGSFPVHIGADFEQTGGAFYCPAESLTFGGSVTPHFDTFFENHDGQIAVSDFSEWWAFIQAQLRWMATLPVYDEETGSYSIVNQEKGLQATFNAEGWLLEDYESGQTSPAWQWRYSYEGIGRGDGHLTGGGAGGISLTDNQTTIVFDRGNVKEWYRYTSNGIEQGFTVTERPEGDGDLILSGAILSGLTVISADEDQVTFGTGSGFSFTYCDLVVYDAQGTRLDAVIRVQALGGTTHLQFLIDDVAAIYPLTIDPISTSPSWTEQGENSNNYFGQSVSTAGDVNGDGYSDIIVGAPGYSSNRGKVYVFHGSVSGMTGTPGAPAWSASGDTGEYFGCSVSTAGDINGDGYSDILIGAYGYLSSTGKAYVFHGSASGIQIGSPSWSSTGETAGDYYGYAVSAAGDVNGDGYSDVIVSAVSYDVYSGKAYVFHGSASGVSNTAAWSAVGPWVYLSFGTSVAGAGDVNADGYSDVIVGSGTDYMGYEGKAYVFHGSAAGITGDSSSPAWSSLGETGADLFGFSVSTAGDVNADGYADILIGASGYSSGTGKAYVFCGSATGITGSASSSAWASAGETAGDNFGASVAAGGDLNNDGYSDVLIGAHGYSSAKGKAYAFYGSASGMSGNAASPAWSATGETNSDRLGASVAAAGDVNGDGLWDVLIGAYRYGIGDNGKVYVYYGTANSLASVPQVRTGESGSTQFGSSVASAGDVNGDGYSDVVVGAYGYSGNIGKAYVFHGSPSGMTGSASSPSWSSQGESGSDYFGSAVAGAGDVNGDGYSDVLVGAYANSMTRGKAYVFYGSAAGISGTAASPGWSVLGEEGTTNHFGTSVSTAGDVNADGYSDVMIGAFYFVSDPAATGKAYVFHGSAAGMTAASAVDADWIGTAESGNDYFGTAVSTAGDVNGDGYSDVIIGAPVYGGYQGKVYVFQGSAAGITGTTAAPAWSMVGSSSGDWFGASVAGAGDVNGDGYSDVVIGAWNVLMATGKVYVFNGASGGITAPTLNEASWSAEGEGTGHYFGSVVAAAGDVNGDGYSDILVGARSYMSLGKAYVFHGSSGGITGTAASAAWSATGGKTGDYFSYTLAGAGDINGDGYSDVIVGAYQYASGQGRIYVYYGNEWRQGGGVGDDPSWQGTGVTNGYFGYSVATAGDVNNDGYSDVIVGAPVGTVSAGRVYVFHGSAQGVTGSASSPAWSVAGEGEDDWFGYSVATAGDVNNDGYSDIIVGTSGDSINPPNGAGKAYVFHGSASGITAASAAAADWSSIGEADGNDFGASVSTAGDVNNDGYSDVIVGADGYSSAKGKVYVFHGSAAGITGNAASPAWSAAGESAGDMFGHSVATAGNVNGDAYSDILVGAYGYSSNTGKAYVFHGSGTGITGTAASPAWSATGQNGSDYFGYSVSAAGDVNQDGYSDVIVGAKGYSTSAGKAYVFHGSSGGMTGNSSTPAWSTVGGVSGDLLGFSVSTAGDVNNDGYADVIVGAYGYSDSRGKVYVFHGSAGGITGEPASPAWSSTGENASDMFGYSVASAGDVNGDGCDDVIIGAYGYSTLTGRAYVYLGSNGAEGGGLSPATSWTAAGQNASDQFGGSLSTAGDVNGDGFSDIIVGAPGFSGDTGKVYVFYGSASGITGTALAPAWSVEGETAGDKFGGSVSTAGDVNGDGYSDVVIGAYRYDSLAGKVYVFHGSVSGLSGTAAWTVAGLTQPFALGCTVANAGDVNADGYSDILVAASVIDSSGAVYVFHGSSSGITGNLTSPAWSASGEVEGGNFGSALSTAGDVNGDGYSDIIVGSSYIMFSGKSYVFHGSAAGITGTAASPAWSAAGQNENDIFGNTVSTAGDVNGDGYSDVIVGASGYSSNTGKAYIFYGSASGITGNGASPAWSAVGENAGDYFGRNVSGGGDINGDGYSDVIIGAGGYVLGTGKAYVFLGSAAGLTGNASSPDWSTAGENMADCYTITVSMAGDVNGDGYSDVMIGAYNYSSGAGKVYIYHGHGLSARAIQLKSNGDPMQVLGLSDDTGFKIRVHARSLFGRGKLKLLWEVQELGTAFDGSFSTSSSWTDSGNFGTLLTESMTGLSSGTAYHWRVRVLYAGAQGSSQWYYGSHNAGEASLRTLVVTGSVTVGGTFYTAEDQLTNIGLNKTIALWVNGAAVGSDETDGNGAFSFSGVSLSAGQVFVLFIDNEDGYEGDIVSIALNDSSDMTGLAGYTNKIVLRHESAGPVTNTLLNTAGDSTDDADIHYAVTGTGPFNVDFENGFEVWIEAGKTYTPGGTVELEDLEVKGSSATFNPAANAVAVHGNWLVNSGGVFTSTGTVTFDASTGTKTIASGSQAFKNIAFNDSAGNATFRITSALDVDGTFTLTDGILDLDTNDPTVNIAGNITINGGSITKGSGLVTFDGDLTYDDNVGGVNFGAIAIGTSPDTTDLASNLTADSLTVNLGDIFNTNGYDLTINGNITIAGTLDATDDVAGDNTTISLTGNWSNTGSFVEDDSTVIFAKTSDVQTLNNGSDSFYNVTHNQAGTLRLVSDLALLNGGTLLQSAGTFDTETNSKAVTIGSSGTSSTLTFSGGTWEGDDGTGATQNVVVWGSAAFSSGTFKKGSNTLTIKNDMDASGATFNGGSGSITLTDTFTLSSGVFTSTSGTFYVGGAWQKYGGSFTPNGGTVEFNGTDQTIIGSNTFHHLSKVESTNNGTHSTWTFTPGTTTTVEGNWTVDGLDDTDKILLVSSGPTVRWTIAVTGTCTIDYATVTDSNNTSAAVINENSDSTVTSGGNNLRWVFFAASGNTWLGETSSTWSTGSNWADGSAPSSGETAYFDGTVSTNNATIAASISIGAMNLNSSYTGTITVNAGQTITLSGALTMAGGTINANSTALSITANSINQTGGTIKTTTSGTLSINSTGSVSSFAFDVINAAGILYIGNTTEPSSVTFNDAVTSGGNIEIYSDGDISNNGSLTANGGASQVWLYVDRDNSGATTVDAGTTSGSYLYIEAGSGANTDLTVTGFFADSDVYVGLFTTPKSLLLDGSWSQSDGDIYLVSNGDISLDMLLDTGLSQYVYFRPGITASSATVNFLSGLSMTTDGFYIETSKDLTLEGTLTIYTGSGWLNVRNNGAYPNSIQMNATLTVSTASFSSRSDITLNDNITGNANFYLDIDNSGGTVTFTRSSGTISGNTTINVGSSEAAALTVAGIVTNGTLNIGGTYQPTTLTMSGTATASAISLYSNGAINQTAAVTANGGATAVKYYPDNNNSGGAAEDVFIDATGALTLSSPVTVYTRGDLIIGNSSQVTTLNINGALTTPTGYGITITAQDVNIAASVTPTDSFLDMDLSGNLAVTGGTVNASCR
ncbi:MAG: FG-GAP-like repeat-containing protein [Candidatus Omnitrophota bacterium]